MFQHHISLYAHALSLSVTACLTNQCFSITSLCAHALSFGVSLLHLWCLKTVLRCFDISCSNSASAILLYCRYYDLMINNNSITLAIFVCKANFNVQNRDRVCVCLYCVCVPLANNSSETVEVTIVLIVMTLTFIQGHTDLNHENNECFIISTTIQAMTMRFAVNIVRLRVYMAIASPMSLTFIQSHQCTSNVTTF